MSEIAKTLVIIAQIMVGEAAILGEAAMIATGHVFINRLLDPQRSYGITPEEVAKGFHGYDPNIEFPDRVKVLVDLVIVDRAVQGSKADPTGGCMFLYSHQDIAALFPDNASCVRPTANWQSEWNRVDDVTYRLYGFKKQPKASNESPLCDPRWEN